MMGGRAVFRRVDSCMVLETRKAQNWTAEPNSGVFKCQTEEFGLPLSFASVNLRPHRILSTAPIWLGFQACATTSNLVEMGLANFLPRLALNCDPSISAS
jgi:hypothetical protein